MNKVPIRIASVLLLASLLLTGCWSKREIESLGFATIVALDKVEEQIELSAQFAITAALGEGGTEGTGKGGGSEAPVWTVSYKATDLASAIENMRTFVGKYPFWGHTRVLVIGEELARSGIAPVLDYIMRSRDFRFSTWVMVSEGPAKELLQVTPKLSKLPAELVAELNLIARETSVSAPRTLLDLLQLLVEEQGSEPILPMLVKHEAPTQQSKGTEGQGQGQRGQGQGQGQQEQADNNAESLAMVGLAAFQGDKMVGKLDAAESRAVLWLRGESRRGNLVVEVPGRGYFVQGQIYGRRTLKITQEDGDLKAKITIYQDGDLIEHNLDQFELNEAAIKELDGLLTARIQADVEATLWKIQKELKTDIIGIGERAYRLYPQLFQSLNWQEYYPTMPIEVEVHASFRRTGEMLQSPLTSKYRSR